MCLIYEATIQFNDTPENQETYTFSEDVGILEDDESIFYYGVTRDEAIASIGQQGLEFTILKVGDYLNKVTK